MDLSKAFDSLNHNLFLTKLKADGLGNSSLEFLCSFTSNRYQLCKINICFSEWKRVLAGIPQRFLLGPLSFNIFINDLFLFLQRYELAKYADNSTLILI